MIPPKFLSQVYLNDNPIAMTSCLYDGPHKELYFRNIDIFVGSHLRYCQKNEIDYYSFNNRLLTEDDLGGLLTNEEIEFTISSTAFGLYKWVTALYLTQIKGYEGVMVVDYDTTFFREDVPPQEMYKHKLGVSNKHPWAQVNAPSVFFFDRWLAIDSLQYEYWFNTGLFWVRKDLDYVPFLREFIHEAKAVLNTDTFAMNQYAPLGHDCLYKANDEIFCQLLIQKNSVDYFVFPSDWNAGADDTNTILRHYTDKHNIPK